VPGTPLVTKVPLLRMRTWAYPSFCRLTFDVPAGTAFVARGVQRVEKWFDAEARDSVGLTLRCSADEGRGIFKKVR
jgi:hypothetical protein